MSEACHYCSVQAWCPIHRLDREAGASGALLPCPFCGSADLVVVNTHTAAFWVECRQCGAEAHGEAMNGSGPRVFEYARDSAIAAWNRRAPIPTSPPPIPTTPNETAAERRGAERERAAVVAFMDLNLHLGAVQLLALIQRGDHRRAERGPIPRVPEAAAFWRRLLVRWEQWEAAEEPGSDSADKVLNAIEKLADEYRSVRECDEEEPERGEHRREGEGATTFTCPKCGRVSHNQNDATNRYCGACHEFFDGEGEG